MTKPDTALSKRTFDNPWIAFVFGGPLNIAMIGYFAFMVSMGGRRDFYTSIWMLFVPTVLLAGITVWRLQRLDSFGGGRVFVEVLLAWTIVTAISPFLLEGPEFLSAFIGQGSFSAGWRGVVRVYSEPEFFPIVPAMSAMLGMPSAIVLLIACFATSQRSELRPSEIG